MPTLTIVVGTALALLVVLLVILGRLLLRLRSQTLRQKQTEAALANHNQDAHEQRLKSLEMISLATLAGDCELSEGCLRVRALLRDYPGLRAAPEFEPIEALYEDIRHLPVGDARRRLPEGVLERQDEARRAIEGRHRAAVLASFQTLRERAADLAGSRFDVAVATDAVRDPRIAPTPP